MLRCLPLLTTALIFAAALAGCGDEPTQPKTASPTRIVFASNRVGNMEIWVMNADGTDPRQLTVTANNSLSPSWSPDGSKVLFTRWWRVGAGVVGGLFRMNSDGSQAACLDSTPNAYYGSPHYSPDGTRIVFEHNDRIWLVNADGSGKIQLTGAERGRNPDWSPDGTRLAYQRDTVLGWRIYTMKPDGTDTLKVIETGVANSNQYQPAWSPDGASIVYVDDHGVQATEDFTWIDIANADGTNIRPLSPATNGIRSEPCWSPDGLRIAYRDDIYPADIFSMNPDGTGVVNVTQHSGGDDISPDWGPAAP